MDLSDLNLLLSAPSKQIIDQVLQYVYVTRNQPIDLSDDGEQSPLQRLRSTLSLGEDVSDIQISNLREALRECIQVPLASGRLEDLAEMFNDHGEQVNGKLKQLIGQLIQANLDTWKEASHFDRISLPKLQDFDWALNFKRASSEISDMQVPTVLMSLTVENVPTSTSTMPDTQQIKFELSREALETMIDGFGKIRDQLNSMK